LSAKQKTQSIHVAALGLDHPVLDIHTHALIRKLWKEGPLDHVRHANPDAYASADELGRPDFMRWMLAEQGVSHAAILAEEAPITSGMIDSVSILKYAAQVDEFYAFVSLNPFLETSLVGRLDELRSMGTVKGIKLLPPYQHFAPNDACVYPLYDRAQELGLPVTFHTGTSRFPGTRLKYADPLLVDDVAVDFPRLTILLAHAGRGVWYKEAALLAQLHENVYLDIAGLPPRNLPAYFPNLSRIAHKLVFGSDFPGVPSVADNVRAVVELFGSEQARQILWETGARILGIDEETSASSLQARMQR